MYTTTCGVIDYLLRINSHLILYHYINTCNVLSLILQQRQNCDAPRFSCRFNNPCDPECVSGQQFYPGSGPRKYVECVEGQCVDRRCSWRYGRTEWNQDAGACLSRSGYVTALQLQQLNANLVT